MAETVASFTDAWIETVPNANSFYNIESHLLQMRGLKLSFATKRALSWVSHLLQMRGLKRYDALNMPEYLGSHLLQMRGLKQKRCATSTGTQEVASFTDAWIETR